MLANPHDIYTYLFLFHEGDQSVRNWEIRDKEKLRDKQFPVRHFPQVFLVQIGQAFIFSQETRQIDARDFFTVSTKYLCKLKFIW